jgi:hypothetical protein
VRKVTRLIDTGTKHSIRKEKHLGARAPTHKIGGYV